jgi:hypothetical protein
MTIQNLMTPHYWLCDDEHQKFQMLIGMLNWVVTIGRFDVAHHATMSLSRIAVCPKKCQLKFYSTLKLSNNRTWAKINGHN